MAVTLDISCPNCGKKLKVPAELEGKKLKCKDCQEVFAVKAPKAPPPPKAEEKPPETPKSPFLDEDDDENLPPGVAPKPMGVIREDDAPRCPHCANELDPPDAVVCKFCGFNNKTRVKAESKKVIEADAADWATHLAPGIIAAVIAIALIVVDIICWVNMSDWLSGSFLEKDDKNPVTGNVEYFVKPGAFTMGIIAVSVFIIIPAGRFAFRRLVLHAKPVEKVKK